MGDGSVLDFLFRGYSQRIRAVLDFGDFDFSSSAGFLLNRSRIRRRIYGLALGAGDCSCLRVARILQFPTRMFVHH
jgi:PIN domain nuclease of toxin-antitoxin system